MVPPMRLSWASVLIFLSLSMSSKVGVLKWICTIWRVEGCSSYPEEKIPISSLLFYLPNTVFFAEESNLKCLTLFFLKVLYSAMIGCITFSVVSIVSQSASSLSYREFIECRYIGLFRISKSISYRTSHIEYLDTGISICHFPVFFGTTKN